VDGGRTAGWAVSVGTGLALSALATGGLSVAAVVAGAPTSVVWQAIGADGPPPKASTLTRGGQDLPWQGIHGEVLLPQVIKHAITGKLPGRPRSTAMRLHNAYAKGLDHDPVTAAVIPVERIDAPLLLIGGTADEMWPSDQMATAIYHRRRQAGVGGGDQLLILPDAGHFLRPPGIPATVNHNDGLVSGGTPEGNARGARTAWNAALAFLAASTIGPGGTA
jgi:alpha-beta hydrolase superfamily lysophospholipase